MTYPRQRLPLKSILVRSLISLIWWGLRWLWSSVQLGDNPACCCGIKRVDSNEFLINNILWKPNLTHRKMSYGFSGGLSGEMSKLIFPFFFFLFLCFFYFFFLLFFSLFIFSSFSFTFFHFLDLNSFFGYILEATLWLSIYLTTHVYFFQKQKKWKLKKKS